MITFLSLCILTTKFRGIGIWLLCLTIGCSIAFWNTARTTHNLTLWHIEQLAPMRNITLIGTITDPPDRRPLTTHYLLDDLTVITPQGTIPMQGSVLVRHRNGWPRCTQYQRMRATGELERPEPFNGFAYDDYLSIRGIYALLSFGQIECLQEYPSWTLQGTLTDWRERTEATINRIYPEPHASFMAGLITGSRKGIPDTISDAFQITGLTHIIAISGYNISLVILLLGGLLFFIPVQWRFIPSVIGVILFTMFVGAGASVVRAAIMGILGLTALQAGRLYDVRLAVVWAAALMTLWNPKLLWYDPGFQLSFLAVLGLTELSPYLERIVRWIPTTLGMREAVQMTIAAQIFAIPWLALLFESISLISPLSNLIVAPFIPLAMMSGAIAILLYPFSPAIAQLAAVPGYLSLEFVMNAAVWMAKVPGALLPLPPLHSAVIVGYFVLLLGFLWWQEKKSHQQSASSHQKNTED